MKSLVKKFLTVAALFLLSSPAMAQCANGQCSTRSVSTPFGFNAPVRTALKREAAAVHHFRPVRNLILNCRR